MDFGSIFIAGNVDLLIIGVSSAAIGILGFDVFLANRKSSTGKAFLFFALSNILWSVSNYFQYQFSDVFVIWATRLHLFITVWYCFSLFQLCYVFPLEKVIFSKNFKSILLPLTVIVSIVTLTPFTLVKITQLAYRGEVSSFEHGIGMVLFVLFVVTLIVTSIYTLFNKFRKSAGVEKKQFTLLLIAISVAFSLHIIFNLIFPAAFHETNFIPFGILFSALMIIFIGYAVFRYHLMNVKVITTEVIAFAISVITLLEVVQEKNVTFILLRTVIFILALTFGLLLIKSVREEVRQREKIEELNKNLEVAYENEKKNKEEIEVLATELGKANIALKQLDKVKDQFLMTTQHDLRRPLTSVKWFLDMLVTGTLGKQTKKTLEGAQKVQMSVESSIEEVNDFLDIAQFQMGKSGVTLKPNVEILPILDTIVAKLKSLADDHGIYLKFEKPAKSPLIEADPVKLKASLSNIVDNSIKYTPKGGVTITLTSDAKLVRIVVKDTGIGIPKDKLTAIFDNLFERTEQAKQTTSFGKGVGLHASTDIIKKHNGKIWAESEGEGKGSTFIIELPVYIASEHPVQPSTQIVPSVSPPAPAKEPNPFAAHPSL